MTLIKFLSQTTSLGIEVQVKRNHRDAISLYYNHFNSTRLMSFNVKMTRRKREGAGRRGKTHQ